MNHKLLWRAVRNYVLARDGFRCRKCGTYAGPFEADHILEKYKYPELEYDPDNIRTLCHPCHEKRHGRRFGMHQLQMQFLEPADPIIVKEAYDLPLKSKRKFP